MVILYADTVTRSMEGAISETNRRRAIQDAYNKQHGIIPHTVKKDVRDIIEIGAREEDDGHSRRGKQAKGAAPDSAAKTPARKKMTAAQREERIAGLTAEMKAAAKALEFEKAAFLRDEIARLRAEA